MKPLTPAERVESSKKRLLRLKTLRRMKAPLWVIKTEQVAMALNRQGLKFYGLATKASKLQEELVLRHVVPALDAGEQA